MPSPESHSSHRTSGFPYTDPPSIRGSYRSSLPYDHSRKNIKSRIINRGTGQDTLELPLRDENSIKQTYQDVHISTLIADHPEIPLAIFTDKVPDTALNFESREGTLNKEKLWRQVFYAFCVYRSAAVRLLVIP